MRVLAEALWIFVLFSFLGWAVQVVLESVREKRLLNAGFLTLPFLPSVGAGFVLLYGFLARLENVVMLFLSAALLLTLYKYFIARMFDRAFGFRWKDYADRKWKLNMYVSAWEPFLYGLTGVLAVKLAFAPIAALAAALPVSSLDSGSVRALVSSSAFFIRKTSILIPSAMPALLFSLC